MIELTQYTKTIMMLFSLQLIVCVICVCFAVNIWHSRWKNQKDIEIIVVFFESFVFCLFLPLLIMSPLYILLFTSIKFS